ncbi:MAG: GNAT family N-acetyltransferase [Thermoleophilaceae bacterium]
MTGWPTELTVRMEGALVVVEPLAPEHEEGLLAAAADRSLWDFMPAVPSTATDTYAAESPERFHLWMEEALAASAAGREGAFAILDRETGVPIGSTRYLSLRPEHAGLEIGWTWLGRPCWRTGRNLETKLLLLTRAFETLGCERVELKCDARNARSRAAMEALPARFEGIHRRHRRLPDGWRDTAWYSVVGPEWPEVRAALRERLRRGRALTWSRSQTPT